MDSKTSRRGFLKGALGLGAAAALGPLVKFAEPVKAAPKEVPIEVPPEVQEFAAYPTRYAVGSGDVFIDASNFGDVNRTYLVETAVVDKPLHPSWRVRKVKR